MGKEYAIGIDLGGTFIKGGVIDLKGKVLGSTSIETQAGKGPDVVLERMAELSRQVVQIAKISWDQVKCVGVGTPGPLSRAKGIVYTAPNLPGWENVRVVKVLKRKLHKPVFLENDANAAAYAENWVGAGRGASSMIILTLGTGIGGGVVLEGDVWHGRDDAAGELGHMSINFDGPKCNCGSYGCIEAYASAPATVRRALDGIEQGKRTSLRKLLGKNGEITAKDIYVAAVGGDKFALRTIQSTGKLLGIAVANFVNIFNPELVVLFGGLAGAGDMLFDPVRDEVRRRALKPAADTVRIVPARLGGNAGIIGAAGCALRALETSAS
ncbi:MAG TPA: ROK family protein [Planctomycetota bacterium]|nr:ROK family protein [Planctomycetota bacterium]